MVDCNTAAPSRTAKRNELGNQDALQPSNRTSQLAGSGASTLVAGHTYGVNNISGNGLTILGNVTTERLLYHFRNEAEDRRRELILRTLYYEGLQTRAQQISARAGSVKSIGWIWSTCFAGWLENEDPIFWITGLPGSGKSSLMSHIAKSGTTNLLLKPSGYDWISVQFYFDYRAGLGISNTVEGMLRALLHQLIPELPRSKRVDSTAMLESSQNFTIYDLTDMILKVIRLVKQKICVFVDGLDEYKGSCTDLLDVVHKIADQAKPRVKLCVASRPEPIFRSQFSGIPHLAIQEYNHQSIRFYTESVWQNQRIGAEAKLPAELSKVVQAKAAGNFLWARLVMDQAVQGLLCGKSIHQLRRDLSQMPGDVEGMYHETLKRLPELMQNEAAILLHLIAHSKGTLDVRRLYAGLISVIRNTSSEALVLPVDHEADNRSRLMLVLGSFIDLDYRSGTDNRSLERRYVYQVGTMIQYSVRIKLSHETLQEFCLHSPWLQARLPSTLKDRYPNIIWFRLYADEMEVCECIDHSLTSWIAEEVGDFIRRVLKAQYEFEDEERMEQELLALLNLWPRWTSLLPYALDGIWEEIKHIKPWSEGAQAAYRKAIDSNAFMLHCAICVFRRYF